MSAEETQMNDMSIAKVGGAASGWVESLPDRIDFAAIRAAIESVGYRVTGKGETEGQRTEVEAPDPEQAVREAEYALLMRKFWIVSTVDAACLTLMARRGQIRGATVDGPLAFDNAISARAAKEKGIVSPVAGEADISLVPDLISGNILAQNLEYLAGAIAAGIAVGLAVPVVLTSRADPAPAQLASLALAAHVHHRMARVESKAGAPESSLHSAPQPEHACCPLPG
jgi:hypothetical protein